MCDGKGGVEPILDDPLNGLEDNYCIMDCILNHERFHRRDALRRNPTVCKGMARGTGISWDDGERIGSERGAYDSEKRCLESKKRTMCLIDKCLDKVNQRIRDIKELRP